MSLNFKDLEFDGVPTDDDEHALMDDAASETSLIDEDVDYDCVYALFDFLAMVEGQVTVKQGDRLSLLDDSNSYWWLIQVLKDNQIGYIPADNVETPYEKLARINKHKNLKLTQADPELLIAQRNKSSLPQIANRRSVYFHENPVTQEFVTYTQDSDSEDDYLMYDDSIYSDGDYYESEQYYEESEEELENNTPTDQQVDNYSDNSDEDPHQDSKNTHFSDKNNSANSKTNLSQNKNIAGNSAHNNNQQTQKTYRIFIGYIDDNVEVSPKHEIIEIDRSDLFSDVLLDSLREFNLDVSKPSLYQLQAYITKLENIRIIYPEEQVGAVFDEISDEVGIPNFIPQRGDINPTILELILLPQETFSIAQTQTLNASFTTSEIENSSISKLSSDMNNIDPISPMSPSTRADNILDSYYTSNNSDTNMYNQTNNLYKLQSPSIETDKTTRGSNANLISSPISPSIQGEYGIDSINKNLNYTKPQESQSSGYLYDQYSTTRSPTSNLEKSQSDDYWNIDRMISEITNDNPNQNKIDSTSTESITPDSTTHSFAKHPEINKFIPSSIEVDESEHLSDFKSPSQPIKHVFDNSPLYQSSPPVNSILNTQTDSTSNPLIRNNSPFHNIQEDDQHKTEKISLANINDQAHSENIQPEKNYDANRKIDQIHTNKIRKSDALINSQPDLYQNKKVVDINESHKRNTIIGINEISPIDAQNHRDIFSTNIDSFDDQLSSENNSTLDMFKAPTKLNYNSFDSSLKNSNSSLNYPQNPNKSANNNGLSLLNTKRGYFDTVSNNLPLISPETKSQDNLINNNVSPDFDLFNESIQPPKTNPQNSTDLYSTKNILEDSNQTLQTEKVSNGSDLNKESTRNLSIPPNKVSGSETVNLDDKSGKIISNYISSNPTHSETNASNTSFINDDTNNQGTSLSTLSLSRNIAEDLEMDSDLNNVNKLKASHEFNADTANESEWPQTDSKENSPKSMNLVLDQIGDTNKGYLNNLESYEQDKLPESINSSPLSTQIKKTNLVLPEPNIQNTAILPENRQLNIEPDMSKSNVSDIHINNTSDTSVITNPFKRNNPDYNKKKDNEIDQNEHEKNSLLNQNIKAKTSIPLNQINTTDVNNQTNSLSGIFNARELSPIDNIFHEKDVFFKEKNNNAIISDTNKDNITDHSIVKESKDVNGGLSNTNGLPVDDRSISNLRNQKININTNFDSKQYYSDNSVKTEAKKSSVISNFISDSSPSSSSIENGLYVIESKENTSKAKKHMSHPGDNKTIASLLKHREDVGSNGTSQKLGKLTGNRISTSFPQSKRSLTQLNRRQGKQQTDNSPSEHIHRGSPTSSLNGSYARSYSSATNGNHHTIHRQKGGSYTSVDGFHVNRGSRKLSSMVSQVTDLELPLDNWLVMMRGWHDYESTTFEKTYLDIFRELDGMNSLEKDDKFRKENTSRSTYHESLQPTPKDLFDVSSAVRSLSTHNTDSQNLLDYVYEETRRIGQRLDGLEMDLKSTAKLLVDSM
ncbi:hypothetical protein BB559_002285 [Furculomyces boomerangus]|uniref:SH3 domain-containing protein n=2 Tax=Harpellales TaxID=61421 RepID=A0A2T9YWG5_9FUNG|nr:hypothetical protein BB559_002285 [Furculomyces boomerangus]PWA02867.1 hypothetical protein BB558_000957 [Smittium angustum]